MTTPEFNADDGVDPADEIARLRAHAVEHERRAVTLHGERNDLLVHADLLREVIEATEDASIGDTRYANALTAFWEGAE